VPQLFNPATASRQALAAYGFPPRPVAASRPQAYALWLRATSPSIKRITPNLLVTNIYHHTQLASGQSSKNADATSSNWSGFVNYWGGTTFSASQIDNIQGYWAVPLATVAFAPIPLVGRAGAGGSAGHDSNPYVEREKGKILTQMSADKKRINTDSENC
jgi:hypothetical protein